MCGLACPFGVILSGGTPVPVYGFNTGQYSYVNTPYQSEPMHLREMNQQDVLSLLAWHIGQKKVAVKCDLCYFDEKGPACVRACPHKALSLIDVKTDEEAVRIERMKTPAGVGDGEDRFVAVAVGRRDVAGLDRLSGDEPCDGRRNRRAGINVVAGEGERDRQGSRTKPQAQRSRLSAKPTPGPPFF